MERRPARLGILFLRLQPAGVGDRQGELVVAEHQRGQIDDNAVLIADAQARKAAEAIADDRLDDQGLGQPECQGANRVALHAHLKPRVSIDPLSIGRERHLDVVIKDVERGKVVLVVGAPPARQLFLRGVHADVLSPFTVEK